MRDTAMAFYVYQDVQRHWRWYLNTANHRKIANSGEGYWNKTDCLAAINLVKGTSLTPVYDA